ncbi:unnamed protein product [Prorocentrum cordatum]|uniref:Uncharacterized protein n=1 Tax=Prorocentrum cordatum TaxID=2364126 RepID=A0ABN9QKV7_9DINO|nr:unnamed protein product [Polarella glacialis]
MRRALAVLLALLAPAALGLLVPAGAPPSEAFAPGSESFVLDSALLQVNAEAHSEGEAISNQSIHVKAHHRREGREGRRERTSNEAEMLLQQDAALEESEASLGGGTPGTPRSTPRRAAAAARGPRTPRPPTPLAGSTWASRAAPPPTPSAKT